jgi:O-succinylbenzoate synthase
MLESGVGRAANLALAAMPGCTLPGDVSASDRYWVEDITTPFVLEDGHVRVPTGPGIGVTPDVERLNAFAVSREWIPIEPARRAHEGALQGIRRPWS